MDSRTAVVTAVVVACALSWLALPVAADEVASVVPGQVELPLALYNQLVEGARPAAGEPPPPASFALGRGDLTVSIDADGSAEVGAVIDARVFVDDWVLVPMLPAGTAIADFTVGGAAVALARGTDGLAWSHRGAGSFRLELTYRIDAASFAGGHSLSVPLPPAAALALTATVPGTHLDVAVIPATAVRTTVVGGSTRVTAALPASNGFQLSWRRPSAQCHTVDRAVYRGRLTGAAVAWSGEYAVELFADETLTLPLLPRSVTLAEVSVDGSEAPVLTAGERFATLVKGRGRHTVKVEFEVPVARRDGPPRLEMDLLPVPVSRLELTLPGKKEVSITPAANVTHESRGQTTVASANVGLTAHVNIAWAEAVPEEDRTEVRANAAVYHTAYAEEGVLYVRALVDLELTRGASNLVRLALPADVQVNAIRSPSGAVADWRLASGDGRQSATIFLDRQLQGKMLFDIEVDRSLAIAASEEGLEMPLVRVLNAQRQRGMVALLQSSESALVPISEELTTRVGENQLPDFVRQALTLPVAHTFKYSETSPRLIIGVAAPERRAARFDARVDTLISLGEVTLKGAASIDIDIKSGLLSDLQFELPADVNLLSLSGPSLRRHGLVAAGAGQRVEVEFTQEMEGQLRLEAVFERILSDGEAEVRVPLLAVVGAEVEQGRIAVEALAAAEVAVAAATELLALDTSELPRQLILRTTHPILEAFKYVQATPPPSLKLSVTRHRLLAVQEAAIDRAEYRTLVTEDGLAVTTARFTVRNSGQQFLKLGLPRGVEPEDFQVASVRVDDRPEKPALETGDGRSQVLVKIVHSTDSFPVELIYRTPASPIGRLGAVRLELPRPDILATETRWDVYLPAGVRYFEPASNMKLQTQGAFVSGEDLGVETARLQEGLENPGALRLTVPSAGIHFAFDKLYANADPEAEIFVEIPYASSAGRGLGTAVVLAGTVLFWVGLLSMAQRRLDLRRAGVLTFVGAAVVIVMVFYFHASFAPALVASGLIVPAMAVWWFRRMRQEQAEASA